MNSLHHSLTEYLKLRRAFGYKLDRIETRLRRFISFLDEKRTSRITTALALQFATEQSQRAQATSLGYLCAVRGFAQYLASFDSMVEVPPPGLLRPSLRGRLKSLAQVKDRVADRIVIDTMDGNNWWDKNVSERFAG
jgi:hypothetical protein